MATEPEKRVDRAQRIKQLRKLAHKTQEDAAQGIGVTVRAYQLWEHGGELSHKNLRRAAEYFGSTPDWIQYGDLGPPNVAESTVLDRLTALESALDSIKNQLEKSLAGERRLAALLEDLTKLLDRFDSGRPR